MSHKGGDTKDVIPRSSVVMVSDTVDHLERLVPESTVPRLHALDSALHRDGGTTRKGPRYKLGDGQSCTQASSWRSMPLTGAPGRGGQSSRSIHGSSVLCQVVAIHGEARCRTSWSKGVASTSRGERRRSDGETWSSWLFLSRAGGWPPRDQPSRT